MTRRLSRWMGGSLAACLSTTIAFGAPNASSPDWIPSGTLYHSDTPAFLQDLTVFARFHYQQAWVDGDARGREFWYDTQGEIRRFWPGFKARFAEGALTLHHEMMLEDDAHPRGGDRDLSYKANWMSFAEWQLDQTFPQIPGGSWWMGYGKRYLPLDEEVLDSSKFMPVVERSALSNRALITTDGGSAPLGAWVRHQSGPWESFLGVYSTDSAAYWGNWDDGIAWIAQTQRDLAEWTGTDSALAALAFYYQDTQDREETLSGQWNWVASAWATLQEGPWTLRGNLLFGEADSTSSLQDGHVWGAVTTVQRWLIPGKLEAVGRLHYQSSSASQGITPYSRYIPIAVSRELSAPTPSVRGDEQQSLYLGLNAFIHGQNLKLMGAVEWDRISSQSTAVFHGHTYWLALRSYF
ncbi:hypothetical protein HNR46_002447 [Haloferula luteola]|uniref:Alginate export domain-containing protein n=1 Tax=Haloferula luteola TaxID=595692 RepID=A0A840V9E2_9BACT|nr:hypothetical protein [Haloferula luteola]MBB5352204.1 hypothetical protein [Haloferula luteola]